ncbi:hypothetical protein MMC18_000692 [Xylographa bjoerkii]|nr:hypothetical protein [Xylographa bjoerkii]
MDPLSALGMASSVFALVGVAAKITHYLDTLSEKWHEAAFMIISLRIQVESFKGALEELHNWMVTEFRHTSNSDSFVQKLDLSLEGCSRLLCAMEQKVRALSSNPENPSKRDKTVLLWTESGIRDASDSLQCQANALMLLLQCRTLSQQGKLLSSESNRQVIRKMSDQTAWMRQIQERENTPNARGEGDTTSLSILFQNQDIVPFEDSLDSAVYAEHLTSLFEKASLSSSPTSSQDTLLPAGDGTVVSAVEDRTYPEERRQNEYNEIAVAVTQEEAQSTSRKTPFNFARMMPGGPAGGASTSTDIVPSFPKFRILVIGQAGVGKSTLCSKILGISEDSAGVSSRGIGTPIGKVWEEITFPGQNENLILHDSGGFEAGSELAMQEIKKFIESRKKESKMADQLHCIWYCISCSGHRPIQQAEKYFFEAIDTGPIPVIVVFTQYDLRVREHFSDWIESPDAETLSKEQGRKVASEKAFEDYHEHYKGALLNQVKDRTKISICRVGIFKGSETNGDGHEDTDFLGTTALIAATLDGLNNDRLRLIWMVAQRQRVDYFVKASVERCIDHFWTVQKYSRIPVPVLGVATIGSAYARVIVSLRYIWKIKTEPEITMDAGTMSFLEASLGVSTSKLLFNTMALAYDTLGPLTGTLTAKIILKVIVGCTLMFERLFWLQQDQGDQVKPINLRQMLDVSYRFSGSQQRKTMSDVIEESVKLSNCFSRTKAKIIVRKAIDMAKTEHENYPNHNRS